jgi:hypothetical protein
MSAPDDDTAGAETSVIRFEIRIGNDLVVCGVTDEALDAASGLTDPSTPAIRRRSFDRFRTLIHQAAKMRFQTQPPGRVGPILLTSADLRRVPPQTGYPNFGTAGRQH